MKTRTGMTAMRLSHVLQILVVFAFPLGTALSAQATTITILNLDGLGEGFNDPTPAAPIGGNTGTTVGQQRLIAFQAAANIWAGRLLSTVPIRVRANFDPLMPCNSSFGILGHAGPVSYRRDFTGAPHPSTWYPYALASSLLGIDIDPISDDIQATFNSSVGTPGCLDTSAWYYGLDGNAPANKFDLVTVVAHELGHGLGFTTVVDLPTGAKLTGFNDAYMLNLERHGGTPSDYPSMTNAQRVAASMDSINLHWVGQAVRAMSGLLSSGKVGDHVRMYAPAVQVSSSSVTHWDTSLSPNQLLEPSYTAPIHNPGLETALLRDIGWLVSSCLPSDTTLCIDDQPGDGRFEIQTTFQTAQGGGSAGSGHTVSLSSLGITHGGVVSFFEASNPELLVKILPKCTDNGHFWVFASAGTNVGLTITITDVKTGAQKIYTNPDSHPMSPIQDITAFACP
jgi:hypothetical protein